MTPEEERELRELQDPDTWDWDTGELHPPVPNPRAVVAVEFASDEFQRVGIAAHQAGVRVTQFIHDLVLAHLSAQARDR